MSETGIKALACIALAVAGAAAASEITSELVTTSLIEDGKPVRLELLVSKPGGAGPFPTVVFNHGSTGRGNNPELFRRSQSSPEIAAYFVERGWMVIFPQRRGRGASDGRYDEGFEPDRSRYTCHTNVSLAGVDRAIEDLDAVMSHIKARPDVRPDRMLIAGQSRGGILAIAYAGERPASFIGVVNFVGGWSGEACMNATRINSSAFRRGAKFPHPTLWLYGEQDFLYSLDHSKSNFEAFRAAGGKGQFHSYAAPGQAPGHFIIGHPALWSGDLTKYLEALPVRTAVK